MYFLPIDEGEILNLFTPSEISFINTGINTGIQILIA